MQNYTLARSVERQGSNNDLSITGHELQAVANDQRQVSVRTGYMKRAQLIGFGVFFSCFTTIFLLQAVQHQYSTDTASIISNDIWCRRAALLLYCFIVNVRKTTCCLQERSENVLTHAFLNN